MEIINRQKADLVYQAIDKSEFYTGAAEKESRSLMNVTFRLPSESLEKEFVKQAAKNGMAGLKGHRSVGGCRASIYNSTPMEAVKALVDYMDEFARKSG